MTAEFPTVDSCREWLQARPQFVDVLGPVNEDLTIEIDRMLRHALRPHDAAERHLLDEQRRAREAEAARADEAMAAAQAEAHDAERNRVDRLGPDDPMTVVWKLGGSVENAVPLDSRPIPPAVVEAVAAWVAERNTWIAGRGLTVRAAEVTVWPGAVPPGQDRIHAGGQFEAS